MSKIKAVVVHTSGTVQPIELDTNDLDALQELVGGYIEGVSLDAYRLYSYINEEGKLRGLARNDRATRIAWISPGDYVVGPMVIVGHCDTAGNDTDIPEEFLEALESGTELEFISRNRVETHLGD